METQYLCDIYRNDYEIYLKQAILFNKKINVMYPAINYPRPIDQRNLKTIVSKLNQYKGFSNVSIIPMEGQSNRFFDFNSYPQLFDTVCKYLSLSKIEKECLLDRSNAEFAYLAFMDRVDGRFCDYIRGVLNIAIEYADMCRLFCESYSTHIGNITSNSDLLYELLDSDVLQEKSNDNLEFWNRSFSGNCGQCKAQKKAMVSKFNQIIVKEHAIRILLPDYSMLPVEEIYEIQAKAKDEIEQLSAYIDNISIVAHDADELDLLLKIYITPSVSELNAKVKGMKLTALQKALSVKDICTIPLLVTLMPDLPSFIPLALSAAFISADIALETYKEYFNLKKDPLYFTIRLRSEMKKRKR